NSDSGMLVDADFAGKGEQAFGKAKLGWVMHCITANATLKQPVPVSSIPARSRRLVDKSSCRYLW
ncbi:MAG: hypothetical protein V3V10_00075, partial [Planctomycetota bacterium]